MNARLTRRSFLLGSAVVVGADTLAACSSSNSGSSASTSSSATGANYDELKLDQAA